MQISRRRQRIAVVLTLAAALTGVGAGAGAGTGAAAADPGGSPGSVVTLATFAGADEHPESIALGADATVHVALHAAARLWHRRPGGATFTTELPRSPAPGALTRANGIAVAPDGVLSVAVLSTDAAYAGVWEGRPGRAFRRVATLPPTASPNGMSRDRAGNLYVADDALGLIWLVPARRTGTRGSTSAGSGAAAPGVWLRHPLLDRAPGGTPYGANGTEIVGRELWVGNPSQTLLVAVPIAPDGRPGRPVVRQRGAVFADVDDFDVTRDGSLIAARLGAGTVERIRPDGTTTVLASAADGLSQPSAVAVDPRRRTAYVTNAAFYRPPGAAAASVQAITVRDC